MIDWIMIVSVSCGVMVGSEIARRRAARAGKIFCLHPVWMYHGFTVLAAVAAVLFLESAEHALKSPASETVWMVICCAVAAMVLLIVHTSIELRIARQRLESNTTV